MGCSCCFRAWPQGQHPRVYPKMAGCWVLGAGVHTSIHSHGHATSASASVVVMLVCLCCWFASQHASMPTTGGAGMLGCMPTAQTCQHFSPPPSLAGHRPACQHANMPTTGDAGMLGCTPVAQTDQHSCPPPSLAGHQPACQHANNWGAGMLGCMPAAQTHQHSWAPPGALVDDQPAREGAKNAGLSVLLGCTPACQHSGCGMLAC